MNVRLSIVIRRDLEMSPGLLAAQACHMNDDWLRRRLRLQLVKGKLPKVAEGQSADYRVTMTPAQSQWCAGPVLSILAVNIPEELEELKKKAKDVGVEFWVWRDTIPSKVLGTPDKPRYLEVDVGLAFGPDDDEKIKQVTGGLPLY